MIPANPLPVPSPSSSKVKASEEKSIPPDPNVTVESPLIFAKTLLTKVDPTPTTSLSIVLTALT